MANKHLLLVDGDPKSLRILEVSLKKAGFSVAAVTGGLEAWGSIEERIPDLVISDTVTSDDVDGLELCRCLKEDERYRDVPFVFLTSDGARPTKVKALELGAEDYLTRPVFQKDLLARVRLVLERCERERMARGDSADGFSGELADVSLIDLVQTIEMGARTGTFTLHACERKGRVWFRDGMIVDAAIDDAAGEAAFHRLLNWSDGIFQVEYGDVDRRARITAPTSELLLEGMRRQEEWSGLASSLPSMKERLVADYKVIVDILPEVPEEVNDVLRLFDGRRTLEQVAFDAPVDDLDALAIVARLYSKGMLRAPRAAPACKPSLNDWLAAPVSGDEAGTDAVSSVEGVSAVDESSKGDSGAARVEDEWFAGPDDEDHDEAAPSAVADEGVASELDDRPGASPSRAEEHGDPSLDLLFPEERPAAEARPAAAQSRRASLPEVSLGDDFSPLRIVKFPPRRGAYLERLRQEIVAAREAEAGEEGELSASSPNVIVSGIDPEERDGADMPGSSEGEPPAEDAHREQPPVEDPVCEAPPVEEPVEEPPVEEPPVEEPPVEPPPAEDSPAGGGSTEERELPREEEDLERAFFGETLPPAEDDESSNVGVDSSEPAWVQSDLGAGEQEKASGSTEEESEPDGQGSIAAQPAEVEPTSDEPVGAEAADELERAFLGGDDRADEPESEEPVAEEPAAEQPEAEEPAAEEPAAEEPAAEEPVAEEPAAEEPVAEEPVAEEPVASSSDSDLEEAFFAAGDSGLLAGEDEALVEPAVEPKRGSRAGITVAAVVALVAVGGGGAWYALTSGADHGGSDPAATTEPAATNGVPTGDAPADSPAPAEEGILVEGREEADAAVAEADLDGDTEPAEHLPAELAGDPGELGAADGDGEDSSALEPAAPAETLAAVEQDASRAQEPAAPDSTEEQPSAVAEPPPAAARPEPAPQAPRERRPAVTPTVASEPDREAELRGALSAAAAHYQAGRIEEAIAGYERAVALNPRSAAAHLGLANGYFEVDRLAEALEHVSRALGLQSNNARAHLLLGTINSTRGDDAAAARSYRRYLELAPNGEFADDVRAILSAME